MNKEKELIKNTIIITIGKIATQFISFFLLPLYTAILTTEEYGIVDLLNTYVSLLIPIITFQVIQGVFRFLIDYRKEEEQKQTLITTSLFFIIFQSMVFLVIFFIIGNYIENQYKYFLATNVIAMTFSNFMLQISRGLGDNKSYSVGSFITAVSAVLLNVLFIAVIKWGAYGMLIATLISNILCTAYLFYKKRIYKYIHINSFSKTKLKEILKYSFPLIPHSISWWIINASDRTILSLFLGIGITGIYSIATKFSAIIETFYNIFNLTWTESASVYVKDAEKDNFFNNTINTTYNFFSAICFGVIGCMPFIFPILINERYMDAYTQIPLLVLSTLFNIVIGLLGGIYIANKKTKEVAKTSLISAIINLLVNVLLVKKIGIYAASLSTFIAYLTMMIYRYIDVQKYAKIKIKTKTIFINVLLILVILPLYYLKNFYTNIIMFIIVVIYAIFINLKTFNSIFKMFKEKMMKKSDS